MLGSQRLEVTFAKGDSLDLRHAARRTKPNCPTRGGSTSLYGEPDPSADDTGRTLVVENFPRRITAAQLKSHLYGSVSAQVKFMEVNRKSQAILIFATRPAAELVQSLDGIIIGGRRISISFEDLTTPPFELSTSSSSHFANHGADKPSSSQNSRSRASIQSTDEFGRQRRAPSNESHSADDGRELSP